MSHNITTIYIVRHAESESNANSEKISVNPSLTELGRKQAITLAEKFKSVHFDAIFSSQLQRAEQTAEIIALPHNLSVVRVLNIHERVFGSNRENYNKEKRDAIEGPLSKLSENEVFNFRYSLDGETSKESYIRLLTFLKNVAIEYKGKTILIVSHGNIMRWFLIQHGFAKFNELPRGSLNNTGYYILKTDGNMFTIKKTQGVEKQKGKTSHA